MTTLTSDRVEVDLDPVAFNRGVEELGWGDGLPCIPPTEELVLEYVAAAGRPADEVIAVLPPRHAECTVEKIAVNAALTGAPTAAMPLLISCIEAIAHPDFGLPGVQATTACVVPAFFVNGAVRHQLGLPMGPSCFGGMRGPAPSIGRALRLVIRHVAGQEAGVTSESVFGQPARVVGLVAGENEERSPWGPLAERRGVAGSAVTAVGILGTTNIVDTIGEGPDHLLRLIGRSAGYMGSPGYLAATAWSEFTIALNPVWADIIASKYSDARDVQQRLWEEASLHASDLPEVSAETISERIGSDGRVHVVASPDDVLVMVCGGEGSLHATLMTGFSHSQAVTAAVR
jgi:hypothetical protein